MPSKKRPSHPRQARQGRSLTQSATTSRQSQRQRQHQKPDDKPEEKPILIMLHKPFGVLSQFTDSEQRQTLKDLIPIEGVYPCGRLDRDSEGLLLLTNNGALQHQLSHPKHKKVKVYWVQVDGQITTDAISKLQSGVELNDGPTLPCFAKAIEQPKGLYPRDPPVRFRKSVPTSWLEIHLKEGRNRQVRRMSAAVGFPTLRLIRAQIASYKLGELAPGQWRYA